jgi:hypothetical protein
MKTILLGLLLCIAPSLRSEPVKLRLPGEAVMLVNALASLDGEDRIIEDANGKPRAMKVAFDFGKDSVRIRLAVRRDIVVLKEALEAYDVARVGYVKQVFGKESLTEAEFAAAPAEKRAEFAGKAAPLALPTALDLQLFTEADVTTFAAAGVPGTTSVALDSLVAKPAKK